MVFISPINRLESINDLNKVSSTNNISDNTDFRNIFNQAVSDVVKTESDLAKEQYKFVSGQSEDTFSLGIASTKAQISVDTLISIRNKALESYSELMRIGL